VVTYKFGTIDLLIIPDELVDITVVHPLGHNREPVPFQIHTDKGKDVRVM